MGLLKPPGLRGRQRRRGEKAGDISREAWGSGPGTRGTGRGTGETVSFGHGSGVQKAGHGLITQQTEKPESCCVHWSSAKTSLSGEKTERQDAALPTSASTALGEYCEWTQGGALRTSDAGRIFRIQPLRRYKLRSLTRNVYVSNKRVFVVH